VGAVVLDASVLIGFLNPADVQHEPSSAAIAAHRRAANSFLLPATVLAETLVTTARHQPSRVDEVTELLDSLFGPVRVLDEPVAVEAARLRAKHKSLRLADALAVATGVVDDASEILTADMRLTRADRRVKVI
jgi:predicted nucleic acid-binding protein